MTSGLGGLGLDNLEYGTKFCPSQLEFEDDSPAFRRDLQSALDCMDDLKVHMCRLATTSRQLAWNGAAFSESGRLFADECFHFPIPNLLAMGKEPSVDENSSEPEIETALKNGMEAVCEAIRQADNLRDTLLSNYENAFAAPLSQFVTGDIRKTMESVANFHEQSRLHREAILRVTSQRKGAEEGLVRKAEADRLDRESAAELSRFDAVASLHRSTAAHGIEFIERMCGLAYSQLAFFHQCYEIFTRILPSVTHLQQAAERLRAAFDSQNKQTERARATLERQLKDKKMRTIVGYQPSSVARAVGGDGIGESAGCQRHERCGYLLIREAKEARRCWFTLVQGTLYYEDEYEATTTNRSEIDLLLCTVREYSKGDWRFCFELITPSHTLLIQAESEAACRSWVNKIRDAIEKSYYGLQSSVGGRSQSLPGGGRRDVVSSCCASDSLRTSSSAVDLRHKEKSDVVNQSHAIVHSSTTTSNTLSCQGSSNAESPQNGGFAWAVATTPGNSTCADCGRSCPQWVSINHGTLMCIQCSGIHRGLGVHVSRVRSLTLDTDFQDRPELLAILTKLGNEKANHILEEKKEAVASKPREDAPRGVRAAFIKAKYAQREYVGDKDYNVAAKNLLRGAVEDDPALVLSGLVLCGGNADLIVSSNPNLYVRRLHRNSSGHGSRSSSNVISCSGLSPGSSSSECSTGNRGDGSPENSGSSTGPKRARMSATNLSSASDGSSNLSRCSSTTAPLPSKANFPDTPTSQISRPCCGPSNVIGDTRDRSDIISASSAGPTPPRSEKDRQIDCDARVSSPGHRDEQDKGKLSYSLSELSTEGVCAAHVAAANGSMAALAFLLLNGATVDKTDGQGLTPLHHACAAGHVGCVRLLSEHGATGIPALQPHEPALNAASSTSNAVVGATTTSDCVAYGDIQQQWRSSVGAKRRASLAASMWNKIPTPLELAHDAGHHACVEILKTQRHVVSSRTIPPHSASRATVPSPPTDSPRKALDIGHRPLPPTAALPGPAQASMQGSLRKTSKPKPRTRIASTESDSVGRMQSVRASAAAAAAAVMGRSRASTTECTNTTFASSVLGPKQNANPASQAAKMGQSGSKSCDTHPPSAEVGVFFPPGVTMGVAGSTRSEGPGDADARSSGVGSTALHLASPVAQSDSAASASPSLSCPTPTVTDPKPRSSGGVAGVFSSFNMRTTLQGLLSRRLVPDSSQSPASASRSSFPQAHSDTRDTRGGRIFHNDGAPAKSHLNGKTYEAPISGVPVSPFLSSSAGANLPSTPETPTRGRMSNSPMRLERRRSLSEERAKTCSSSAHANEEVTMVVHTPVQISFASATPQAKGATGDHRCLTPSVQSGKKKTFFNRLSVDRDSSNGSTGIRFLDLHMPGR